MRLDREAFQKDFRSELFFDVGSIYVCSDCNPPKADLQELVRLGGGSVVNVARVADVIIGTGGGKLKNVDRTSTTHVNEKWLLDSVQFHAPMPFQDYEIEL